eukprot:TRINITY_DN402_c0_g1_i1.p1 TRINITY_DN402_c0_g1~~TRINITY_DN402_c0_g1_i1.p1  ORF type:complete len:293 (-),score=28.61 TRINITY_DN402_c0_g1_i1:546-1424(-)
MSSVANEMDSTSSAPLPSTLSCTTPSATSPLGKQGKVPSTAAAAVLSPPRLAPRSGSTSGPPTGLNHNQESESQFSFVSTASSDMHSVSSMSSSHTSGHTVHNFGVVMPQITRSGFPRTQDALLYLESLHVKTVLTLAPIAPKNEEFYRGLKEFTSSHRINHVYIPLLKAADLQEDYTERVMAAIALLRDQRNYPIHVHCNRGRHRTGVVVACLRKVLGQESMEAIESEYLSYAQEKARPRDIHYIRQFDVTRCVAQNGASPPLEPGVAVVEETADTDTDMDLATPTTPTTV